MFRYFSVPFGVLLLTSVLFAANWPAWRGPDGQGHSPEKELPLNWGPDQNVRWKIDLPADGNSTPIVWGNQIFLTQATEQGSRRALMCLARSDGHLLWKKEVVYKEKEPTHATNPYCSASPVTDGERVVVSFGSAGTYCYDFDGNEKWKYDTGKLVHIWGNASSPILYDNLAILWCGPGEKAFLVAVDKISGAKVWQHDEPGTEAKAFAGSWSTPIIAKVGDHDELIVGVPKKLKGFDPKKGDELWSCDGLGDLVYTSPLYADGIVVAMSGYGGPALAVKLGGKGDVTKDRLWHHTSKNPQRVGSGVIIGEHVYILSEPGLAQCFELKTGKEIWGSKRLGSTSWGSMTAAGNRLYVTNQTGTTYVLEASPEFKELAVNKLDERSNSSVAISDGELFLRTYKHLWCIKGK